MISKSEFRREAQALGLIGDPLDIDVLFDSLDDDLSGELDSKEMRAALKKLAAEAESVKVIIKALTRKASELSKAAKAAQGEWQAARDADIRAAAEEDARLKQEAAARAAEAKKGKQREAEEQKRRETEVAEAFAEKIRLKREAAKAKAEAAKANAS